MPRRSLKGSSKAAPVEEVYEMEDVVDYKVDDKGVERFLVKWKGYPSSQNTWEPEGNILEPSAAMKSKMIQLRASAAKEPEKPAAKTSTKASKTKPKPSSSTTKTPVAPPPPPPATSSQKPASSQKATASQKPTPSASSATAAAAPKPTITEARGTKRKPPPPPETSPEQESSSAEIVHQVPEGKVIVWHMGRGPEEAVEEYKVTLRWENGYQVVRSVSYVREKYPEALLDYLLSRVRFRK